MRNFNLLPQTSHCSMVKVIAGIVSGDGVNQARYFEEITSAISQEFDTNCKSLALSQSDSSLIIRLCNSIEMMNGLAQAGDFMTASAIYTIIAPKFSALLQLLVAFRDNGEVVTCILQLYASVSQFVCVNDINGCAPVDYYAQFTALFQTFGGILAGDGIRGEELTDVLVIVFEMLEGLVSNTMMSEDPSSSDAVFSGMVHVVLAKISAGMLEDLKFCGGFIKLVSLIVTFFSAARFAAFSPVLLDGLMKGLEYGVEHASFEIAADSFEALAALGSSCYRELTMNGMFRIL
jgi:hypothetical protein